MRAWARGTAFVCAASLLMACEAIVTESDALDAGGSPVVDASRADAAGLQPTPDDARGPVADAAAIGQPGSDAGRDASETIDTKDAGAGTMAEPEGRLNGIVAAHNRVRAAVVTSPPLAPLLWDANIAAFAQTWADSLAVTCEIMHRTSDMLQPKDYGENIATFGASGSAAPSDAQKAVEGWAAEKMCWTYGTLSGFGLAGTEKCEATCYQKLFSDGCGHYTAIVSRRSTAFGCGVATCKKGGNTFDIWVCNYAPAGNFAGRAPY